MKNFPILILAGYSAVGKSTLGPAICEKYNFLYINHQELLHSIAKSKGFERSRYWLAEVGVNNFVDVSVNEMARRIKENADTEKGFLIDAAYGNQMITKLKNSFPKARVLVISVLADPEIRQKRIMGRMSAERELAMLERQFRDSFLIEAGLEEVMKHPDFVVHNTGELNDTIRKISEFLELQGIRSS